MAGLPGAMRNAVNRSLAGLLPGDGGGRNPGAAIMPGARTMAMREP